MRDTLFKRLESVQNATARLVTGAPRRDRITPVLRRLHWLPVRQTVVYWLTVIMFRQQYGQLPSYLARDCQCLSATGRRPLRSSDVSTVAIPRSHTSFVDRCFSVGGSNIWNGLSAPLRGCNISFDHSRRDLKTFLMTETAAHLWLSICNLRRLWKPYSLTHSLTHSCIPIHTHTERWIA